MGHRRVDGRKDDIVKSMAIASYGDETTRREGLQARVRDKDPLHWNPFVRASPQPVYPNELISIYQGR